MNVSREQVKLLIELSATTKEADEAIEESYGFKTIVEKMAFLKGMFDIQILFKDDADGVSKEQSEEMDYWTLLELIIHSKFDR